jgi:O-antigen/teichoic acid export membrane protein
MLGLLNNLSLYNTRHKKFKIIATANIIRSTSMSLIQLGGAFVLKGAFGLLLGFVLSFFSGNIRLIKTILVKKDFFSNISKTKIIALFKLYRDFPKFSVWAILLNKLASELLNIILSIVFSITTLGFYSFANKILGIPSTFVGAAVSNVIMKEAADERNKYGNAIKTFNLVVKKMSLLFLPVFVLFFFFIEDVFGFVFGKEWIIAGTYGKIILPFIFIRFVASPLSIFFIVFEKQKLELLWQFLLFVFSMTSISIAYFYKLDIIQFLYIFSTVMSLHYIVLIILSYNISRKHV